MQTRIGLSGALLTLAAILLPLMLVGCNGGGKAQRPEGVASGDIIVDNPRGNGVQGKKKAGGADN